MILNELEQIHNLSKAHKIQMTDHALKRANERSIDILTDILPALKRCEIIEEYPNDYPYKSFLVIGKTSSEKYIHIVCAIGEDVVWIITEYFPNNIEWEKDFKTRNVYYVNQVQKISLQIILQIWGIALLLYTTCLLKYVHNVAKNHIHSTFLFVFKN